MEASEYLLAMHLQAICYNAQRKFWQAWPVFEKCLEIRRDKLGNSHPHTLESIDRLASFYEFYLGLNNDAELLYFESFVSRLRLLGIEHLDTLKSMNSLAIHYMSRKKYEQAIILCEDCYNTRKAKLTEKHPDTLISMYNLASLYLKKKNFERAEELFRTCSELQRSVFGQEDVNTLNSEFMLAKTYMRLRDYATAQEICDGCLNRQRKFLGRSHADTIASLKLLIRIRRTRREYSYFLLDDDESTHENSFNDTALLYEAVISDFKRWLEAPEIIAVVVFGYSLLLGLEVGIIALRVNNYIYLPGEYLLLPLVPVILFFVSVFFLLIWKRDGFESRIVRSVSRLFLIFTGIPTFLSLVFFIVLTIIGDEIWASVSLSELLCFTSLFVFQIFGIILLNYFKSPKFMRLLFCRFT